MKRHTATGFFWSERDGHRYCVVILDDTRYEWRIRDVRGGRERVRQKYVREYHANTIRTLRRMAARAGWNLGPRVRANCLAQPPHPGNCRWRYHGSMAEVTRDAIARH